MVSYSTTTTRAIRTTLFVVLFAAGTAPAWAVQADTRPPGTDPKPRQHFCIKNAESGACEDCWSDSKGSSKGGTCKLLKESTNDPNVRKGACTDKANIDFCKQTKTGKP